MSDTKIVATYKKVIVNPNSWVLFEHGTVVIFLPGELAGINDLRAEAVIRLRLLTIRTDVIVGEWLGQGKGWIVNCGSDYILTYCSHDGQYLTRYDRIIEASKAIAEDQQGLKIIHVERK